MIPLILFVVWLASHPVSSDTNEVDCSHEHNDPWKCFLSGIPGVPGSRLIADIRQWKYGVPFATRTGEFNFPEPDDTGLYEITYISVFSNKEPGDEGTVTLVGGGVGSGIANFTMESVIDKGYDFQFKIEGIDLLDAASFI